MAYIIIGKIRFDKTGYFIVSDEGVAPNRIHGNTPYVSATQEEARLFAEEHCVKEDADSNKIAYWIFFIDARTTGTVTVI
jgi:hypothetical protein